jgi:ankyrin repeat protein
MSGMKKRQALVAADLMLKNPKLKEKTVHRLSAFLSELDSKYDNTPDDWEYWHSRCHRERQADEQVLLTSCAPKRVIEQEHNDRLNHLVITNEGKDPGLAVQKQLNQANRTDPESLDYQDPKRFYRTKLHLAIPDRNLPEIRKLLAAGACPHIKDATGQTALQLAINEGYMDLANVLLDAMKRMPMLMTIKIA